MERPRDTSESDDFLSAIRLRILAFRDECDEYPSTSEIDVVPDPDLDLGSGHPDVHPMVRTLFYS